ncbi:MAG: SGNH/GDSL hydrolase family protein [Candidatus Hinthialibacter sp.]
MNNSPRTTPWCFYIFMIVGVIVMTIITGEMLCRIAGVGRPNLTLTGPKQLYVADTDPHIAFRMRPHYSDFVYGAQVSINANGLRDYDYPYEKPAGVKRILVLGDSVAFGYGVDMEKTFAKQWEKALQETHKSAWQVINSGVPAYTTVQEMRWFELEGLRYQPDAVVIAYVMNDPEEVHPLRSDGLLDQIEIDAFYQKMAELIPPPIMPFTRYSHLSKFINRWLMHTHPNWKILHEELTRYFCRDIFERESWNQCQEAFLRLHDLCRENDIFLLAAIYPLMYRLHAREEHSFTPHYERVEQFLQRAGIQHVTPLDDFIGQPVDEMRAYADDPHPSPKSHRIFARRLHQEFAERWRQYAVDERAAPAEIQ